MFCRSLFVLFLLAIELSVLLRYADSDYLFGIFKLFLRNICVTNDHGYVPLVVNTSSFLYSFMTYNGFLIRITRRVSLVEQELPTLPEHMSSFPGF